MNREGELRDGRYGCPINVRFCCVINSGINCAINCGIKNPGGKSRVSVYLISRRLCLCLVLGIVMVRIPAS